MGLTALSVVCSVWTSSLYHCSTSTRQVPRCLRRAARTLNRLVRVHDDEAFVTSLADVSKRSDLQRFGLRNTNRLALRRNALRDAKNNVPSTGSMEFKMAAPVVGTCQACVTQAPAVGDVKRGSERRRCDTGPSHTERYAQVTSELLRKLTALLQRQDAILEQVRSISRQNDVNAEWRQVSQVLDRFFFWLFLVLTLVTTVVILILVPLSKDLKQDFEFT